MSDIMNLNSLSQYFFLDKILLILIVLVVSFLIIHISAYLINKVIKHFDVDITISTLMKSVIKYFIYLICFIVILEILGINVTGLMISLGVVGLIIGLAGRDVLSNFISGIFILSDKTIKIGEIIEVEDIKGKVEKLGFRTTTLITSDHSIVTIPNSVLSSNPYINYTYLKNQPIELQVSVPYSTDLNHLKEVLVNKIDTLPWVLKDKPPKISVKKMDEEDILLEISVQTNSYAKIGEHKLNLAEEFRKIINQYNP